MLLEAGYVRATSGYGSSVSGFDPQKGKWGQRGLAYLYLVDRTVSDLRVRLQYLKVPLDIDDRGKKIEKSDYRYFDLKYRFHTSIIKSIKIKYLINSYYKQPDFRIKTSFRDQSSAFARACR